MKQEPEWIDIVALIAMHSLLQTAAKSAKPEQIAYAAYRQAEAMMEAKEEFENYDK
jgi:hypothetical protein